jgi:pimeloyl-ACP methyl ester carboxylesterase
MISQIPNFFICIIIAVFVCGCASNRIVYPLPEYPAVAGNLVTKVGSFKTNSNTYKADFSTITVPENRDSSTSRLIHLPIIRIYSPQKKSNEPIFGLTGGPGTSNLKWMPLDSLLSDHDFVMVGYRGVDGETVLRCPEVEKALKSSDDILSEDVLKKIGEAWSASAKQLIDQGIDLNGYTIKEVIEDIEEVRKKFGYTRINLLSESYGTRIAYFYGDIYPSSVFRSVMIGVNPPGHFIWDTQTVDSQLKYYANLWSKDSLVNKKCIDLYATMKSVLDNMPKKWLIFSINPGKVKAVTFALLFHRKTAAMVFNSYLAAEHGDPSGLALMSFASDYVLPSMFTWGDLASKAISVDFDSTKNYSNEVESKNYALGSPLSKLLWGPLIYGHWPIFQLPDRFRTLHRSYVETLLLSGSTDFSTPSEFATKELLPNLPNGKQIILQEYGHVGDIWKIKPETTERIITSYYNTGEPDTSSISYVKMDFGVSWGFPTIAKAALVTTSTIALAVIVGLYYLIK